MTETRTDPRRTSARTGSRRTTDGAEEPAPAETASEQRQHVCNVAFCPIGLGLSAVQGAAPEALEHLLKAAQELLLAARAVVDQRASDFEQHDPTKLERIEIS